MRRNRRWLLWTGFNTEQKLAPEKTSIKTETKIVSQSTGPDILSELNLSNCRITQDQDSHMIKWHGSMYAYDIACERWKTFTIYTPSYFNVYVLESKWTDDKLWNYIVLRHGEYRFVYAHSNTASEIWTRFKAWEAIWETDTSWITTAHHLHIELWKRYNNIRWEHLYWQTIDANPNSFKLALQREWKEFLTIRHKLWDENDYRLEYVQYAYNLWWINFVALLEWENGLWSIDRRSTTSYYRQAKTIKWHLRPAGNYYDYWFCQISDYYHPDITLDKRFYTDWKWQIDKCYELYTWGTVFYASKNIAKNKLRFELN